MNFVKILCKKLQHFFFFLFKKLLISSVKQKNSITNKMNNKLSHSLFDAVIFHLRWYTIKLIFFFIKSIFYTHEKTNTIRVNNNNLNKFCFICSSSQQNIIHSSKYIYRKKFNCDDRNTAYFFLFYISPCFVIHQSHYRILH